MTLMPLRPKIGDTVKVTIEATVSDSDSIGFQVRMKNSPQYQNFVYNSPDLVSVVVTKRRHLRVDDIIDRDEILTWSPNVGTVIRQDDRTIEATRWMKTQTHGWVSSQGEFALPSAMPGGEYVIELIA